MRSDPPPDYADDVSRLRVPPHSSEAEQAVLGGMLLDNAGWDRVGDVLAESDFYSFQHRLIFAAIGQLINASKPADVITVGDRLGDKLNEVGGLVYLNSLTTSTPSASGIRGYALIVREKAIRRRVIALADETATKSFQGDEITAIVDALQTQLIAIERGHDRQAPRSLDGLLVRRLDRITAVQEGAEESGGWSTSFPTLDDMLNGGLRPGKVYVIAARPSVGKSAFAGAIGLHCARAGLPTLFLSQEMPEDELADRALANLGGIDFGRLQIGRMQDIDWPLLSEAVELGTKLPFWVDDEPGLTISAIRRKAHAVRGVKVLILDYLQLSEAQGNHANRNGAIEEISRGIKRLAKELGCAVLLLSQLNRKVEERPHKRPTMADLRDSGAIEQDADVVLFLFPIKERKSEHCIEVGLDVGKNRQGRNGSFALNFWGAHMRWGESTYRLKDLLESKVAVAGGDFE